MARHVSPRKRRTARKYWLSPRRPIDERFIVTNLFGFGGVFVALVLVGVSSLRHGDLTGVVWLAGAALELTAAVFHIRRPLRK